MHLIAENGGGSVHRDMSGETTLRLFWKGDVKLENLGVQTDSWLRKFAYFFLWAYFVQCFVTFDPPI